MVLEREREREEDRRGWTVRIDGERESNGDGWRKKKKKTVSGVVAE